MEPVTEEELEGASSTTSSAAAALTFSEIKRVFSICDSDGDGYITKDELERLLTDIGVEQDDMEDFLWDLPEGFTYEQFESAVEKKKLPPGSNSSSLIQSMNSMTPRSSLAGSTAGVDHSDCNYAIHELNTRNSSLSKQVYSLEVQYHELAQVHEDLQKSEKAKAKELRKLQTTFSSVAAELETVKQANTDIAASEKELKQQLREMRDQRGDMEDALQLTKAELRAAYEAKMRDDPSTSALLVAPETQAELDRLSEALEKSENAFQQLRRANEELQRIHSEDLLQMTVLDARIERLNLELETKDSLFAELGLVPDKPNHGDKLLNTWHGFRTVSPLSSELGNLQNQPPHPSLIAARNLKSSLDSAFVKENVTNVEQLLRREQSNERHPLPLSRSTSEQSGNAGDSECSASASVSESDDPKPSVGHETEPGTETGPDTGAETETERVSDDHTELVANQLMNISDLMITPNDVAHSSPATPTAGITDTDGPSPVESDLEDLRHDTPKHVEDKIEEPVVTSHEVPPEREPQQEKRSEAVPQVRPAEHESAEIVPVSPVKVEDAKGPQEAPASDADTSTLSTSFSSAPDEAQANQRAVAELHRGASYKDVLLKEQQGAGKPKLNVDADFKVLPTNPTTPTRPHRARSSTSPPISPTGPTTPPASLTFTPRTRSTSVTTATGPAVTPATRATPKPASTPAGATPVSTPFTPLTPYTPVTPQRDSVASTPRNRNDEILTTEQLYSKSSTPSTFRIQEPFTPVYRKSDAIRSRSEVQSKSASPWYKSSLPPKPDAPRNKSGLEYNRKSDKRVTPDQAYELHEFALKAGLLRPRGPDYVPKASKASQVDPVELESGVALDGRPLTPSAKEKRLNSRSQRKNANTPHHLDRKIVVRGNPYLVRLLSYPDPQIDEMEEIVSKLETELNGIEQSVLSTPTTTPTKNSASSSSTTPKSTRRRASSLSASSPRATNNYNNKAELWGRWVIVGMVICLVVAAIFATTRPLESVHNNVRLPL